MEISRAALWGTIIYVLATVPVLAQPAEKFKIGVILPFSGPYAIAGEVAKQAMALALEDRGGKVLGVLIEVVWEDGEAKPQAAIQKATKALANGAHILLGEASSHATLALMKLAVQRRTLLLNSILFRPMTASPAQIAIATPSALLCPRSWQYNLAWRARRLRPRHRSDRTAAECLGADRMLAGERGRKPWRRPIIFGPTSARRRCSRPSCSRPAIRGMSSRGCALIDFRRSLPGTGSSSSEHLRGSVKQ